MLLTFCYPHLLTSVPKLQTMDEILPMLKVMKKYGIERSESHLKQAMFTLPIVEVYLITYQHAWDIRNGNRCPV
jgi:hypothetical protein